MRRAMQARRPAKSAAATLRNFPFYEEGKVPQYQKYHANVSYLDELELIWGKRWGAQGIGRLREVAMVRPTEAEVRKLYEETRPSSSSTARRRICV